MKRHWRIGGVFLLTVALLLAPRSAFALKIAPFKLTVMPGDSQVIRIENNADEEAAVQVSVMTWEVAPDGTETNHDAEADFVVFPPQVVLGPHESRAVRIQWLGAMDVPVEKSYRLIAEQLPVRLKETPGSGSAVKFMLKFKAALYVVSGKTQSHVTVAATQITAPGQLSVTLHNDGNGHTLLQKPVLHLKYGDGRTQDLSGDTLKSINGENVHANATRIFTIHFSPLTNAPIASATIDYNTAF